MHRGEIAGFATHDASAKVIAGEFRAASMRLATPAQAAATTASLHDNQAGHYMVYIFTTYGAYSDANGDRRALQFVVSRCAMAHLTPDQIASDLTEAVMCLHCHGFNVKGVSLDGAGENEAATKKLCTLSLRHLIDSPTATRLQLADADLDMPIAWPHPRTRDPVFFIADMGHVIKRLVNALEMSSRAHSKRAMRFVVDPPDRSPPLGYRLRTVGMNLGMLADAYEFSEKGDGSVSAVGGELALTVARGFSTKIFRKDAHSRMSVPYAMRALSASMLKLVDDMLARARCPARSREYTGMRELIRRVNRLVDICNCRSTRVDPPALAINSRSHSLIPELTDTMSFFSKWRADINACPDFETAAARQNAYLSVETHTGLQRLILGIIGTATCHLPEGSSHGCAFNPRRTQSDPCEHEFAMVRQATTGCNPTMQGAMRDTAHRGASKFLKMALETKPQSAPEFDHAVATSSYAPPPPGQGD